MDQAPSQENDLSLFLQAVGVKLPPVDPGRRDGYAVITLAAAAAAWFGGRDGKASILAYRCAGKTHPLSLHFLFGEEKPLFGHSSLLLDSYPEGPGRLEVLQKALPDFFNRDSAAVLGALEPAWKDAVLHGQFPLPFIWHAKPTLKVAVDLFNEKMGTVPEIPLFPMVYSYNNPYVENLLEVSLPEIKPQDKTLVLGTGTGLDAVCLAVKHGVQVDATDINPIAVANTRAAARRVRVDHLVRAWVSDGFTAVPGTYDTILFEAPLAMETSDFNDPNRYDLGGKVLRAALAALPQHLNPGGRLFLMSQPDLAPYITGARVRYITRRFFNPKTPVAIHEVRAGEG